jgi:hypothetical protein
MATTDTETLIEFYGRAEVAPLLMEFAAEAGGDPDQYGSDDVEALAGLGLAPALAIFTQQAVAFGFITDAAVAAAASADDADWSAVATVAMQAFETGMRDL